MSSDEELARKLQSENPEALAQYLQKQKDQQIATQIQDEEWAKHIQETESEWDQATKSQQAKFDEEAAKQILRKEAFQKAQQEMADRDLARKLAES